MTKCCMNEKAGKIVNLLAEGERVGELGCHVEILGLMLLAHLL